MTALTASVAAGSYTEIVEAYEAERPRFEALVGCIQVALEDELLSRGVHFELQGRTKEVMSFAKKALREGYADPLREVADKAGLRVIVPYLQDVPRVEEAVLAVCQIVQREQKLDALEYDRLGYLGVHLEVRAKAEIFVSQPDFGIDQSELSDLSAEIQIHSKAQSAWAVVSHDLLYKPPVECPEGAKRAITRLVALVELFDGEVNRLRNMIEHDPSYEEMAVASEIDDLLIRFTSKRPDRKLSALSIPDLIPLYDCAYDEIVDLYIKPYVDANEEKLASIYAAYKGDARANPLLFQPEALVIFERLATNRDQLREAWPVDRLEIELLEGMATVVGIDL